MIGADSKAGNNFLANSTKDFSALADVDLSKSVYSTVLPHKIFPSRLGIKYWLFSSTMVSRVLTPASRINICPLTGNTSTSTSSGFPNNCLHNCPVQAPAVITTELTAYVSALLAISLILLLLICTFSMPQFSIILTPRCNKSCLSALSKRGFLT
ncbi:hypothetical protein BMETH_573_1 [methanotrophic bacterial endosymbiont of Bathymodiolus sp.]|nr:hypothetical protein BMETH_573_1 [methanotrophic bacterial endosymbiont of Bathymodiolus sp.]